MTSEPSDPPDQGTRANKRFRRLFFSRKAMGTVIAAAVFKLHRQGQAQRQDQLVTLAAQNVSLVAKAVANQAATYEDAEEAERKRFEDLERRLGR